MTVYVFVCVCVCVGISSECGTDDISAVVDANGSQFTSTIPRYGLY